MTSVCPVTEDSLTAALCKASLWEFVKEFWEEVPGAGKMIPNWHMEYLCGCLQQVAERVFKGLPKVHDVVVNISPGTSKSTISSILFPCWAWARMPSARILTASHTDALVLDLATKSRDVIRGEKYRALFPGVELAGSQDTKGYYRNTLGGDRLTCTVAGKSPMGFHAHVVIVDDPIDPKKSVSEAETRNARDFITNVIPTRKVDKAVSVTFLVMQRLGTSDPTAVMLEESRKEGASPLLQVKLPAEITDKFSPTPPELAYQYEEGLMDPRRLGRTVLREFQARGDHFYATQFGQEPYALSGGMFREVFFNQRVKAAPYNAKRIRYWDRASSTSETGCFTAGVLMARDAALNFYVEHVVHGRWEPDERNEVMKATALKDRARYPNDPPVIYVEREGGSSGRDAWKGVARALAGFVVKEHQPTGKKEVRAEPWACQLAARNVFLVEDGTWDVNGYVSEHCSFPLGTYKDQVDASSGAFTLLVSGVKRGPALSTRPFGSNGKKGLLRIVVCRGEDLETLELEGHVALSVWVGDPTPLDTPPPPPAFKPADSLTLLFADLKPEDYQDAWGQPIPPYNRGVDLLAMSREDGKRLWAFLLKKREPAPDLIVLGSPGGKRALSLALGIVDSLGLDKAKQLYCAWDEHSTVAGEPPNGHAYRVVRGTRGLVVG